MWSDSGLACMPDLYEQSVLEIDAGMLVQRSSLDQHVWPCLREGVFQFSLMPGGSSLMMTITAMTMICPMQEGWRLVAEIKRVGERRARGEGQEGLSIIEEDLLAALRLVLQLRSPPVTAAPPPPPYPLPLPCRPADEAKVRVPFALSARHPASSPEPLAHSRTAPWLHSRSDMLSLRVP